LFDIHQVTKYLTLLLFNENYDINSFTAYYFKITNFLFDTDSFTPTGYTYIF
jgi:hypothetical protein